MQCWQLHVCGWNGLFPSELLSFYWCGCYRNKSRYLGIERADMCVLPCVCVCLFVLVTYYGWTESSLSPRWRRLRRCLCGTYWFLVTSHTSVLWTSCISPKTCEVNEQRFPSREEKWLHGWVSQHSAHQEWVELELHSASSLPPCPPAPLKEGSNLLFRDFSHVHSSWHRCDIWLCMVSKFLSCFSHPFSQPWTAASSVALASVGVCLQVA